MESNEENVKDEEYEQIKEDYLTETQRTVYDAVKQLNVHLYCPPANQIAQKAGLDKQETKGILTELCKLGMLILRVSAEGEAYRICKPEEYTKRDRFVINNGAPVSPNQDQSSTGTVSPKVQPKVQPKILSCSKCDFVTKSSAGLHIHVGQKHKTAAGMKNKIRLQELKDAKRKERAPGPMEMVAPPVTIVLTADEALEAGIALALADMISADRFKGSHRISDKIFRALIAQVPQKDLEGAS